MALDENYRKNNWALIDEDGVIDQSNQDEISLIWDCNTRSLEDLQCEYKKEKTEMKKIMKENKRSWNGDLLMVQIMDVTR